MSELTDILRSIRLKRPEPESKPEPFKIRMPNKDVAELNLELMKKLGRFEEADAFQYILDLGLADSFYYESTHSKTYLSAIEYVKRLKALAASNHDGQKNE